MKNSTPQITVKALAALAGLTPARIYQLASDERLPRLVNGKFPRDEAITKLFATYQTDTNELKREKLMLTAASRKLKEQELDKNSSTLIDRALANSVMANVVLTIKAWTIEEVEADPPQKRKAKLEALGAASSVVAAFLEYDVAASQATIGRICRKCQAEVRNTQIKIDQQNEKNKTA